MKRLKLAPGAPPRPHLTLVPPSKSKKRRRWKLPRNFRTSRKPKYGQNPELLRYEEDVVAQALREFGGWTTIEKMVGREPDRWNQQYLAMTLARLVKRGVVGADRSFIWRPGGQTLSPYTSVYYKKGLR